MFTPFWNVVLRPRGIVRTPDGLTRIPTNCPSAGTRAPSRPLRRLNRRSLLTFDGIPSLYARPRFSRAIQRRSGHFEAVKRDSWPIACGSLYRGSPTVPAAVASGIFMPRVSRATNRRARECRAALRTVRATSIRRRSVEDVEKGGRSVADFYIIRRLAV